MPNIHLILVEDHADLRDSLMECLAQSGYDAVAAGSALEFYKLLASHRCDVAILDLGLPDEDGMSIVRYLRQEKPDTRIILCTARGTTADRIAGLRTGADLYLAKPVEYAELEAAIQSLSRRIGNAGENRSSRPDDDWVFHRQNLRLIAPNGLWAPLTTQECRFVGSFVAAGGSPVARTVLLDALGYADDESGHRSLNAVLVRLRTKVAHATDFALPVQAVRGQGYLAHQLRGA
ncbi:response regulator transcription factor [Sphingopyxis sp. JAI128]|uniref:response regulator transcription factor n=1 Tax=Sphingopyxis sp. JAI128 TaxID=2723066 RepID=UPI00161BBE4D|nr:response regulator transcription factor [Sphingopyxis sp. JAI128]MBB6428168.1 DNA-binding response OmpR family regulator [Sphingopyxis sp. JAI128]